LFHHKIIFLRPSRRTQSRVDGGYEVLDREMVEVAVNQFRKMDADREFCRATGGHEPMDEDPDLCRRCGAWRPTATDWPE
jgi:hypothetical protein